MPKTPTPGAAKIAPWPRRKAAPVSVAILAVCIAFIVLMYYSSGPVPVRALFSVVALIICGEAILRINGFPRLFHGTYMARSHIGIKLMDSSSGRWQWFWKGMADWGLAMGFGLLSFAMFRKDMSARMVLFGTASMLVIIAFVIPCSALSFSFINIPQITSRIGQVTAVCVLPTANLPSFVIYAISAMGGFVLYTIALIAYNAILILGGIEVAVAGIISNVPNYSGINSSVPGIAPILPGITIPFFAGILSLALIVSVHEFSHGILARIARIKVLSSGLIVAGIVPIGGFVEPDEKRIKSLSSILQNRISSAGVASNMLLSLVMFVPMLAMAVYVMPHLYQSYISVVSTEKYMPANVLTVGSTILSWDGYPVTNLSQLDAAAVHDTPYSNVTIVTTHGSYTMRANATGKIGLIPGIGERLVAGYLAEAASFLYAFVSLSFLLSFLIALVNYLPIPSLDGWRIFDTSVKNRRYTFAVAAVIIVALYVNVLPWAWIMPYLGIPAAVLGAILIAAGLRWLWKWSSVTRARP